MINVTHHWMSLFLCKKALGSLLFGSKFVFIVSFFSPPLQIKSLTYGIFRCLAPFPLGYSKLRDQITLLVFLGWGRFAALQRIWSILKLAALGPDRQPV